METKSYKGIIYGFIFIGLSAIPGIIIFTVVGEMDGFPDLLVRFLSGMLGLTGFGFASSAGFLIGKELSFPEKELFRPFISRFAIIGISLAVIGFLWGFLCNPWGEWYESSFGIFSYCTFILLSIVAGFVAGSRRVY